MDRLLLQLVPLLLLLPLSACSEKPKYHDIKKVNTSEAALSVDSIAAQAAAEAGSQVEVGEADATLQIQDPYADAAEDGCTVTEIDGGIEIDCGDTKATLEDGADGANGKNSLISVDPITDLIDEQMCASKSGIIISSGLDENGNNVLDEDEIQSKSFVCDGSDGAECTVNDVPDQNAIEIQCGDKSQIVYDGEDGYTSLLSMIRFQCDFETCPTGSGVLLMSGLDLDRDMTLAMEEVTQESFLCDGKVKNSCTLTDRPDINAVEINCAGHVTYVYHGMDGQDGQDGVDGKDGQDGVDGKDGLSSLTENSRFNCSPDICSTGKGTLIRSGLDLNDNQTLEDNEVTSTSYVCDGKDGVDGHDGQDGVDGKDGQDGQDGQDGVDGQSCTVTDMPDAQAVQITCGDTTEYVPYGKDGYQSLIKTSRSDFNEDICSSKKGSLLLSGRDINRNDILDDDEVEQTSFICDGQDGVNGVDGQDCSIADLPDLDAVKITCGDDYQLVYHGKDGEDGENGYHSIVDTFRFDTNQACDGGKGTIISAGFDLNLNGILDTDEVSSQSFVCDGEDGQDGQDGQDGSSCTIAALDDNSGYEITCGDTTETVKHGTDGKDGQDGYNSIIESERIDTDTNLCASGSGTLLRSGFDMNSNGHLELDEVNNATFVCDGANGESCTVADLADGTGIEITCGANSTTILHGQDGQDGQDGQNGLNALVKTEPFTDRTDICASGTGIYLHSGLDTNSNSILDDNEITSTSSTCNGADGQDVNTIAILVSTTPYSGSYCPVTGTGVTIQAGLDIDGNGVLDLLEVLNIILVCD